MKILSQNKKSIIDYAVHYGNWLMDEENSPSWDSDLEAVPSNKIDIRTTRARIFHSKKEAIKFAKEYLKQHQDDKWLAYVEIKKCDIKVIEKLK